MRAADHPRYLRSHQTTTHYPPAHNPPESGTGAHPRRKQACARDNANRTRTQINRHRRNQRHSTTRIGWISRSRQDTTRRLHDDPIQDQITPTTPTTSPSRAKSTRRRNMRNQTYRRRTRLLFLSSFIRVSGLWVIVQ